MENIWRSDPAWRLLVGVHAAVHFGRHVSPGTDVCMARSQSGADVINQPQNKQIDATNKH